MRVSAFLYGYGQDDALLNPECGKRAGMMGRQAHADARIWANGRAGEAFYESALVKRITVKSIFYKKSGDEK